MKDTVQKVIASPSWTAGAGTQNATCTVKLSNQTGTVIENPQIKFTLADNQTLKDSGHVNFTVESTDGSVVTGILTTNKNLPANGEVSFSVAITSDAAISNLPDTFMVNGELSDAPVTQFSGITGFESLSITADTDGTISLYANGRQQARVYVHMVAYDKHERTVTLDGAEKTKMQDAITLVNYQNNTKLTKVDLYADGGSDWSYTVSEGEYEQPETRRENISARNDEQMVFTFYVMCPTGENELNEDVAASVALADGSVIDTISGNNFDSYVPLKGTAPIEYNIAYHSGSQSADDNLRVTVNRIRDTTINGDPAWADHYSVKLNSGVFHNRATARSGNEITGWVYHPGYCLYFRNYAYTNQIANICYWVNAGDTTTTLDKVGWKFPDGDGHFTDVEFNTDQTVFNFLVTRFEDTDDSDNDVTSDNDPRDAHIKCDFRDPYGNPGTFFAYPYPEDENWYHRGYKYEFTTSDPSA